MENKVLDKAILFAVEKHSGMKRKGTNLPYILHPLEAVTIVGSMTDDTGLMAAAALHDVIEDTGVTYDEILEGFGKRVADIVASESENKRERQPAGETWKTRKTESLNHLKTASTDVKMVTLADKLSNIHAIYMDWCRIGDELWNRFNCKEKTEHEWYYRCAAYLTKDLANTHAWLDFEWCIEKVFGYDTNVNIFDVCDKPEPEFSIEKNDVKTMYFRWDCPVDDYMWNLISATLPEAEVVGTIEFEGNNYIEAELKNKR